MQRTLVWRVLLSAGLAALPAHCAETAKTDTPEQQLVYLEDTLADGFRSHDWKVTELALNGLNSQREARENREALVLRAELNAAFSSTKSRAQRAQIEAWGLVARARLGDSA